jgi:hypothetical protein
MSFFLLSNTRRFSTVQRILVHSDKKQVVASFGNPYGRKWYYWFTTAVLILSFFAATKIFEKSIVLLILPIWLSTFVVWMEFLAKKHWEAIQTSLCKHGIRLQICVTCGHDLQCTPDESTSCPECGAAIAAVTGEAHDVLAAEGVGDPPAEPGAEGVEGEGRNGV